MYLGQLGSWAHAIEIMFAKIETPKEVIDDDDRPNSMRKRYTNINMDSQRADYYRPRCQHAFGTSTAYCTRRRMRRPLKLSAFKTLAST
jgi:hypothetical protein